MGCLVLADPEVSHPTKTVTTPLHLNVSSAKYNIGSKLSPFILKAYSRLPGFSVAAEAQAVKF